MSEIIPTDVAKAIQAMVASGEYESEADVLRDAIAALRQRRDDLAAIAAGIADMEAGRLHSYAEVDADFRKKHNLPPAR